MLSIRFAMAAQSATIVALLFCLASVWAAPPVLRGTKSSNATNVTAAQGAVRSFRSFRSSWQHAGCCNGCHTAFCSPQSGSCYDYKGQVLLLGMPIWKFIETLSLRPMTTAVAIALDFALLRVELATTPRARTTIWSAFPNARLEPTLGTGSNWRVKPALSLTSPELIYDVPSREECRNYCKDRSHPWCRTFQFSAASSSCGSRSMCRLLGNCLNMLEPWRWCLLGLLLYRLISTDIDWYRLISTDIDWYRLISTDIDWYRLI